MARTFHHSQRPAPGERAHRVRPYDREAAKRELTRAQREDDIHDDLPAYMVREELEREGLR